MTTRGQLEKIRQFISRDDLPTAIHSLKNILEHTPRLNEILLQSARHQDITKQIKFGVIDFEQANVIKNQIRLSLLGLISEIETQEVHQVEIKQELEKAFPIINSKNVIVGSIITAGRDVQIGNSTTITESKTSRNLRLLLFFLVPLLTIGGVYFWYQYQVIQQPLQVKVIIKNTTPNIALPAPKGSLTLMYNGKQVVKREISESALFETIPANNRNKILHLTYQASGFSPIDTSFLYQSAILLSVKRNGDLAQIRGKVSDETGTQLESVKVTIDCCPAVYTDKTGSFLLSIPFKHQRREQRITLFKEGYKEKSVTDPVIVGELYQYFLKKI